MPVLDGTHIYSPRLNSVLTTIIKGIAATAEIREIEAARRNSSPGWDRARILALTGMSSVEDKRRAFDAGVDG